jgi:hypothetical protein
MNNAAAIPVIVRIDARTYRELRKDCPAFLNANTALANPTIYTRKPPAIGAATFMHGYCARLGLGMTRRRNQIRQTNPVRGKKYRTNILLLNG